MPLADQLYSSLSVAAENFNEGEFRPKLPVLVIAVTPVKVNPEFTAATLPVNPSSTIYADEAPCPIIIWQNDRQEAINKKQLLINGDITLNGLDEPNIASNNCYRSTI